MRQVFIGLMLLLSIICVSQDLETDIPPTYKYGGSLGLTSFVINEFQFRKPPNIKDVGTIVVNCIITENGNIDSIIVWNEINDYMSKEIIRVLNLTNGDWIPSMHYGQPVKAYLSLWPVFTYYGEGENLYKLYNSNKKRALKNYEKGKIQKAILNLNSCINYNPFNHEDFELRAKYKFEINDTTGYSNDLFKAEQLIKHNEILGED